MRSKRTLITLFIAVLAVAGSVAGVTASAQASAKAPVTAAKAASHGQHNPLTGYPTHINTINLNGYVIQTSYPLGKLDAGSTYQQTYTATGVTAIAVAGPYVGSPADNYGYIALPVTRDIFLLVWLEPNSQHNTFVFNFKDHEVSVVTYDQAGDPSLGTFKILKWGKDRTL
jgi:hypothetical protein